MQQILKYFYRRNKVENRIDMSDNIFGQGAFTPPTTNFKGDRRSPVGTEGSNLEHLRSETPFWGLQFEHRRCSECSEEKFKRNDSLFLLPSIKNNIGNFRKLTHLEITYIEEMLNIEELIEIIKVYDDCISLIVDTK